MQLFCANGIVVAIHDDSQSIPADAYPGTTRRVVPNMTALERFGEPPEALKIGEQVRAVLTVAGEEGGDPEAVVPTFMSSLAERTEKAFAELSGEFEDAAPDEASVLALAKRKLIFEAIEILQVLDMADTRAYAEPAIADEPGNYPLNKFQFEAVVLSLGLTIGAIEEAIGKLGLTTFDAAVAVSRLRNATSYSRAHPLVEQVRAALKMKKADLDAAWMQAKDLR